MAIIGPRQAGKTTLARSQVDSRRGALYLDLESREDRDKLADPVLFLRQFERNLVVLDEVHRLTCRPEKGFYSACQDLKPDRRFVVNAGNGQYPIDAETQAIGVRDLAEMLAALA